MGFMGGTRRRSSSLGRPRAGSFLPESICSSLVSSASSISADNDWTHHDCTTEQILPTVLLARHAIMRSDSSAHFYVARFDLTR